MGHKVVFIGPWITRILKNWGIFAITTPRDSLGHSIVLVESMLRNWGYVSVNPGVREPAQAEVPPYEHCGLQSSIMRSVSDVAEMKRIQRKDFRRLKKLKTHILDCMTTLGENMGMQLPP